MDNDVDVLVVDDIPGAAEDYANLIKAATGLRVAYAEDASRALELVRSTSIKILVLDQGMPVIGTELYRQIHDIDPAARAIMLTGQAGPGEVGEALELGYKAYVAKNQVLDKLAQQVLHEYAVYQAEVATAALAGDQPVVLRKKVSRLPWSRELVTYRLRRVDVIKEAHVFDSDWRPLITLHAGQVEETSVSQQLEQSVILEAETASKLTGQLGLTTKHLAELKAQLQSELSERLKYSEAVKATRSQTTKRSFQLPPEPENPNDLHVRVRRILEAHVYGRLRIELLGDCRACGVQSVTAIDVYVPTGARAIRHEDHLSDNEVRKYDLGYE
jgi:CheY-like chemotaxis protein/Fe-S cluster biogenesis protein NfuA